MLGDAGGGLSTFGPGRLREPEEECFVPGVKLRMIRSSVLVATVCAMLAMGIGESAMAQGSIDDVMAATHRVTDKKTSATAFLVWPRQADDAGDKRPILVTAAHALEGMPGSTATLVLRAEDGDSTYTRREADIALRNEGKPLWVRHPELDVAAIPVDLPEGTAAKPLRFEQLADASWAGERKLRVGGDVFIPGYPATLEGNDAGWPVLRRGTVATHPLTPVTAAQRMLVNATTFGGDSGAPVVLAGGDEAVVVGIVVGMQRQTDRSKMEIGRASCRERVFLTV